MADVETCEKCGAWFPAGAERCRNCGALSPHAPALSQRWSPIRPASPSATFGGKGTTESEGSTGLGVAFWCYWVLGSIAWKIVVEAVPPDAVRGVFFFYMAYLTWAAYCVWTAATRRGGGWAAAAKVLVVVGLLFNSFVALTLLAV